MRKLQNGRFTLPILFALIILTAFLLRVTNIGRESLWYDEAISFLTAELPLRSILTNLIRDPHPPFSYIILHFWFKLFSPSDVNGRLLSLLFSMMLLPLIYVLGKELLHKRRLALFAVFLVAISPFHILYSHELRMYTLVMLLAAALGIAYARAERTDNRWWWFAFTITALLMVYTHLFSVFVLTAIGVYALMRRRQGQLLWKTAVIGFGLTILFLPWLYLLFGQSQADMESLRPLTSVDSAFNLLKPITSAAFLLFGQATSLWYGAAVFFLIIAVFVVFLLELRRADMAERHMVHLPGLIVLFTIGMPTLLYFIHPFFLPERTMAAAAPYLILLLAWGLTRRHSPLPFLVMATAVVMLIGSITYHAGDLIKPPYRTVMQYISSQHMGSDVVLHTSDGSYLPALSYVDFSDHAVLAGDPDMRKPTAVYEAYGGQVWSKEASASAGERLWLIVALEHSVEWQQEQAMYFEQYPLLDQREIDGILIYLYNINPSHE